MDAHGVKLRLVEVLPAAVANLAMFCCFVARAEVGFGWVKAGAGTFNGSVATVQLQRNGKCEGECDIAGREVRRCVVADAHFGAREAEWSDCQRNGGPDRWNKVSGCSAFGNG